MIWESLDPNLKVQPFYAFKKKYKLYLLSQYQPLSTVCYLQGFIIPHYYSNPFSWYKPH